MQRQLWNLPGGTQNSVPFFGMEVEPDALVKMFFHVPIADVMDFTGGVVCSGGRWWGGGRLKLYVSEDPSGQRYLPCWVDFDTEHYATARALSMFRYFRRNAKKVDKKRCLEAYLGYPCTTPDGVRQWADKRRLAFFHKLELQSGEKP